MARYWGTDNMVRYGDSGYKPGRLNEIIPQMNKVVDYRLDGSEESAVIVTDTDVQPSLYHAISGVLSLRGIETTVTILPKREMPNMEPPTAVDAAISPDTLDVLVNMCRHTITHTDTVMEIYHSDECKRINLVAPTEDKFLAHGMLATDPEEVEAIVADVAEVLREGDWVEVTSPHGTDVEFNTEGRRQSEADWPLGETPCIPNEGTINGTIIHDSFMMGVGILNEPIEWVVEEGWIEEINGGREAQQLRAVINEYGDENARWIGEFSVMCHLGARPCGNYTEHKQVEGGVHFALGNGTALGGDYYSMIHLDGVQLEPTVRVDGDVLLENGEFHL